MCVNMFQYTETGKRKFYSTSRLDRSSHTVTNYI